MSADQMAAIVLIVLGMIASYAVWNRFGKSHQEAAGLLADVFQPEVMNQEQ